MAKAFLILYVYIYEEKESYQKIEILGWTQHYIINGCWPQSIGKEKSDFKLISPQQQQAQTIVKKGNI
jgi:hypothetical protein